MPPTASNFAKCFGWVCCACILFLVFAVLRPAEEPSYTINLSTYTIRESQETPNLQPEALWQPQLSRWPPVTSELPLGPPQQTVAPSLAHEDLKYILAWTTSANFPFNLMGKGRSIFLKKGCDFTNCFITNDRKYFLDMTDFDAVAFHGKDLWGLKPKDLPKVRSRSQKYIFAMMESSAYYPACGKRWDHYFNWTWTYRLDSDARMGYLTFFDKQDPEKVLGPKVDMDWSGLEKEFDDLPQDDLEKIQGKTRAAAWFVSNCNSKSKREVFAQQLKAEMLKYGMVLDVYGACGTLKCPRKEETRCTDMLERDYFFYLSFENSFAEDYVTEKLFTALDNLAVPLVYGGANYSRFLPPNSYLDARKLGAKETAKRMHELLSDPEKYRRMLRWRTRVQYRIGWEQGIGICDLCKLLNDEKKLQTASDYDHFTSWWNLKDGVC